MKRTYLLLMMFASTLALGSCTDNATNEEPLISKSTETLENDLLNPMVLNSFGRVSDPQVSPDGTQILYGVSYTSVPLNKSNRELFLMNADGSQNRQITHTPKSESNARWYGNDRILFLSQGQLWSMDTEGNNRTQLTTFDKPISEFTLSPQQDRILLVSNVKYGRRPTDLYPELEKASGRLIDDLMYRHWDCFVEEIPHTYVADFNGAAVTHLTDLLEGTQFELPTLPFGGINEICWSPDGTRLAYSCRKKTGVAYAISTNSDIYLRDLTQKGAADGSEDKNLSLGMMGYDTAPLFSPCGKYLVWNSMERDGYEADKIRLMLYAFADGSIRELTTRFKYNVESVTWRPDSKGLYFTSCAEGVTQLFALDLAFDAQGQATGLAGDIRQVTNGLCDLGAMQFANGGNKLVGTYASLSMPTELVAINPADGSYTQLSYENKPILDQLTMGQVEARWITTTDNKKMLTWVVYPPHFDKNQKYPMLLFCAGGPQSTLSQGWSYRWCEQLMAANGYIVILPNRRGTTAFGQEWCEQISGDYAGQNIQDYFSAVDAMKKEPFVDGQHVGAVGASYGGYSIYYLAGHHDGRFAAFIAHAGIFNTEHMYMETEEIWFPNFDNGGAPWDKNPIATRHYANSPHKAVKNWDTPILITHGELDYRVPVDQAMTAFNAAKLLGVPAQMLLFPDENHWILKPQNNILWNNVFFEFLDKYLKP